MSYFLQVLQAIKELLPSDPVVCRCVIDFELAMRSLLADVELMGYVVHCTQALWRKVITSYRTCNICMYMIQLKSTEVVFTVDSR